MSLARFYPIILVALFISSCAQVGTISGGDKDEIAPQPKLSRVFPPNESTNFTAKEIEIPFDEFITLNNPTENIRIVPPHAKLKAVMKKKSLIISWEEELNPNTTYAIYINNAVKDITEGNDTIMQYVLSTGNELDSIKYAVKIIDAWTNLPVEKCIVGLFDPVTREIRNFTETTKNGEALLNYVKADNYQLLAFVDENKDLVVQDHERVGFQIDRNVEIQSSIIDTVPVRMFTPTPKSKIRTKKYLSPSSILIGTTVPLKNETLQLNGEKLSPARYLKLKEDSIRVFLPPSDILNNELVIVSDDLVDTASVRASVSKTPPAITIASQKSNNTFAPSESIAFETNSFITEIDTSVIKAFNKKDSVYVHDYSYTFIYNALTIELDKSLYSELEFHFLNGAILTDAGVNGEQKVNCILNEERKYGSLDLDLSYYSSAVLLQVYFNTKPVKLLSLEGTMERVLINELEPGDYTFKVILDENKNGKWDSGNLDLYLQPEKVDLYSTPTKVRSNWSVEATLIPTR
jgi:hypothetical protein